MKAATGSSLLNKLFNIISIHAAREGGDRHHFARKRNGCSISIHAAREGGDTAKYSLTQKLAISIHAAREGGDFHAL